MGRQRLDQYLVDSGQFPSRSRARDAILRGCVQVDGHVATKPGAQVAVTVCIAIDDPAEGYVARSALKLIGALDAFDVSVEGKSCLDVGQSTGGFTQVLLDRGAWHVTGVDSGHDQLHEALRDHPKVTALEGVNARDPTQLPVGPFDLIVIDVSFISLAPILSPVSDRLTHEGDLIVLFKPQFEVGPRFVGKGGVVTDTEAIDAARSSLVEQLTEISLRHAASIRSPVLGADGNQEHLLHLVRSR